MQPIAPNSLAGEYSSPVTRYANFGSAQDQLTVSEGTFGMQGKYLAIDRWWAIENPSQSGYIMQHVMRSGPRNEYWELFPVDVYAPSIMDPTGSIYFGQGDHDLIEFGGHIGRQNNHEAVKLEAVWLPGYVPNPGDGWHVGNSAGDLLMTSGHPPTGWPAGPYVTSSGNAQISGDPSDRTLTLPRTLTGNFIGSGGTQTFSGTLSPLR